MTDEENKEIDKLTDEENKEVDKLVDEAVASIWPKLRLKMKKRRNDFLRRSREQRKERAREEGRELANRYSDDWWEHIPDDEPRHGLTGLYLTPPVNSHVSICKDHSFVDSWMREEGVFALVVSVQPPPVIIACDETGEPIVGKDGERVRMPGIPLVEIAFAEDEYESGLLLPADCLKVREEDEDQEADKDNKEIKEINEQ